MLNAKGGCDLVDRNDRRVPPTIFKSAYILLTNSSALGELLLRQSFLLSDSGCVAADQFAHVHAQTMTIGGQSFYQL